MQKKLFFLPFRTLFLMCIIFNFQFSIFNAYAQRCLPPSAFATIETNNISARLKNNGTHFFYDEAEFEVPKGSGKTSFFAASLWLGGLDNLDQLHLAAMRYGSRGDDFWAGPLSNAGMEAGSYYNKFWKVTKEEVELHKLCFNDPSAHPFYVIPASIKNWPAHGRTLQYNESYYLAPFVDVDGDGIYMPELGDYPKIPGDEALFFMMNDDCGTHTETGGTALGVEIMCMVYAFNAPDEALQNTLFMSYLIRNKSTNDYKDFHLGWLVDFDLGYGYDDYIGCDSSLNLAYVYNGNEIDGSGQSHAYGENPPVQGAMFLNQKMNSFMTFNNEPGSPQSDPYVASQYYYYLTSKWNDGLPLTYGGTGYNPESTDCTKFVFSGNPVAGTGWTEKTPNGPGSTPNEPRDVRGLMATAPRTLAAGESIKIDITFPFARDNGKNNDPLTLLKERAQIIQEYYNQHLGVEENIVSNNKFLLYPNPSNGQFMVKCEKVIERIEIFDMMGRKVFADTPNVQTKQMNTHLPQGFYMYRAILENNAVCSGKIIVQ